MQAPASSLSAQVGTTNEMHLSSVAAWQESTQSHFLPPDCRADDPQRFRETLLVARFRPTLAAEL